MSMFAYSASAVSEAWASSRRNPIPILLTVRELDQGGIERDVTKIALQLDRSRFRPHVASYRNEGMRLEELRRAGIPFLHLPVSSLKSPAALMAARKMRRYTWKHKIRLVHAFDPTAVLVVPVARGLRVPAVLSSTLGHRDLLDRRSRSQVRWTDRMVDAVVVNCEAMRRHVIDDEHVSSDRVELCYNGVDLRDFYPFATPKPFPVTNAPLVIGTVCVLRAEKRLDLLLKAFAQVRHLRPGMNLLIVGSGPELPALQAHGQALGLHNDCFFVSATPMVPRYLRALDIFVSCSRTEAFSNAILEAMACGVCVVGSRVGGTPELLGDDQRGLLFETGNADDLAAKLTILIANAEARREFGTRAAAFARSLRIEIAAQRMAEIYERVLQRKAAWPPD